MSHREDFEAEEQNRQFDKFQNEKLEKIRNMKNDIKQKLINFLKNSNIKSTWPERDEVIDLAFELQENEVISKKIIITEYDQKVKFAQDSEKVELINYSDFKTKIKNSIMPEFFDYFFSNYDQTQMSVETFLESYLRENCDIPTSISEELEIIKLAKEIINKKIINPKMSEKICNEKINEANEWKNEKLNKFNKYYEKINSSKFNSFLNSI